MSRKPTQLERVWVVLRNRGNDGAYASDIAKELGIKWSDAGAALRALRQHDFAMTQSHNPDKFYRRIPHADTPASQVRQVEQDYRRRLAEKKKAKAQHPLPLLPEAKEPKQPDTPPPEPRACQVKARAISIGMPSGARATFDLRDAKPLYEYLRELFE